MLSHIFGNYKLIEEIGQGGMGVVYRAEHIHTGTIAAIKLIHEHFSGNLGFIERFKREAQVMLTLSHPHIVRVYDMGIQNESSYMVMEYVAGGSLSLWRKAARELKLEDPLRPTISQILQVLCQLCEGLGYAHDRGYLHRDLKPSNILFDKANNVKLSDFGLVKILGKEAFSTAEQAASLGVLMTKAGTMTMTGAQVGTFDYMSPEQREGKSEIDHRSDIYSVGVILYELLTGKLPMGRVKDPSFYNPLVSKELDAIILKSLESAPAERYVQVKLLHTALLEAEKNLQQEKNVRQLQVLEPKMKIDEEKQEQEELRLKNEQERLRVEQGKLERERQKHQKEERLQLAKDIFSKQKKFIEPIMLSVLIILFAMDINWRFLASSLWRTPVIVVVLLLIFALLIRGKFLASTPWRIPYNLLALIIIYIININGKYHILFIPTVLIITALIGYGIILPYSLSHPPFTLQKFKNIPNKRKRLVVPTALAVLIATCIMFSILRTFLVVGIMIVYGIYLNKIIEKDQRKQEEHKMMKEPEQHRESKDKFRRKRRVVVELIILGFLTIIVIVLYAPLFVSFNPINYRSNSMDKRYTVSYFGIITDTKTGLQWAPDPGRDKTWKQAKKYADNLRLGGYTDWRLPTGAELSGLKESSKAHRYGNNRYSVGIDPVFKLSGYWVWNEQRGYSTSPFNFVSEARYWDTRDYPGNLRVLAVRSQR
jgi:serine/threonine protein kinase